MLLGVPETTSILRAYPSNIGALTLRVQLNDRGCHRRQHVQLGKWLLGLLCRTGESIYRRENNSLRSNPLYDSGR